MTGRECSEVVGALVGGALVVYLATGSGNGVCVWCEGEGALVSSFLGTNLFSGDKPTSGRTRMGTLVCKSSPLAVIVPALSMQ